VETDEELEGVPNPGDIIVERYRVESILGVGGMGCVVAATHMTLDTKVAVKFLLAKAAKNPKNIIRFQREAQAAAKIKSDHVAKVSDVGTLATGVPYMVMEYLEGEDLSEHLKRGPVAPPQCVDFLLQASEALAEAHQAGIIHRDLKPANLFLTHTSDGKPRIKVLDFGISKIIDGTGHDLTKTSALMGSPLYMSPEQMMSAKSADARADIWALGCILFEGITCQPPFIGETLPEICSRILTNPPAKLTELAPYAGPGLEAVIERCLTKKPEERFQTLSEMAEALAPFATLSGHKSVNTIRRVQGLPELPQYAGATTSGSQMPSQIAALQAAHGATHGAGASGPHPSYQSYPDGSMPGVSSHGGVSQSGPYTSPSPGQHLGIGATTPLPHGSGPHTTGAAHATGSNPNGPALAVSQALAQGSSTGAPVAQTMSGEELPIKRSKMPLVLGFAALALVGVGAVVVFGLNAGADDGAPAAGEEAALEQPAEPPDTGDEPETSEESSAENTAASSEATIDASASASASATPTLPKPAARPPVAVRPPPARPAPKPAAVKPRPKPAPKPKAGTTVKPGDDQFNNF
jgi:serine/threonine protein kinase